MIELSFNFQFLSVKIVIPDRIQNEIYRLIQQKYFMNAKSIEYSNLLSAALNDAYARKCKPICVVFTWIFCHNLSIISSLIFHSIHRSVKPLMNRQIRSQMTKTAEKEAVEVFAKNLKQLLLLKPVKGKRVLGVDPGFKNGCKLALISEQNDVLDTDCIFPHTKKDKIMIYEHKLINMLKKHK